MAARVQMAVDAIVGDVGRAVLEPFDEDVRLGEGGILDLAEMLGPVNAFGRFGPKCVGIGERPLVHLLVSGVVDEGALGPFGGHFVTLVRHFVILHADDGRLQAFPSPIMRRRPDERQGRGPQPACFVRPRNDGSLLHAAHIANDFPLGVGHRLHRKPRIVDQHHGFEPRLDLGVGQPHRLFQRLDRFDVDYDPRCGG